MEAQVDLERLFKLIKITDACWIWLGAKHTQGYAVYRGGPKGKGGQKKSILVHRYLYKLLRGPIPKGLEPDHLCRVRNCVNPWDLELVTHAENMRRSPLMGKFNREKTHCKYGHPYDEQNTSWSARGRACRACWRRKYYLKREASK